MRFRIAIPARYAAHRLPGKPLRVLAGQPLIEHVYARARDAGAEEVVVATDDSRVAEAVRAFGGEAVLTDPGHATGTDRLAEVARTRGWPEDAVVVNLQGDEPLMPRAVLRQVAEALAARSATEMATLCTRIEAADELFSPHVVKVVRDEAGDALYFSRAPIPWNRDAFAQDPDNLPSDSVYFRHIGLYAYRAGFLRRYPALSPSPLEQCEALEQLRALWHGARIHVAEALEVPPAGVDTEADLDRVAGLLEADHKRQ